MRENEDANGTKELFCFWQGLLRLPGREGNREKSAREGDYTVENILPSAETAARISERQRYKF